MASGSDLIDAIVSNDRLKVINKCPAVPVDVGTAVYGKVQNDTGETKVRLNKLDSDVSTAVGFGGANSETAVWHFQLVPTHHFVVIPWYRYTKPHGQVYSVLMAYENNYTLGQYISGSGKAPATGGKGYKKAWTVTELSTMLKDLMTSHVAWQAYFGQVGQTQATKMYYYKYKVISVDKAYGNVGRY